MKTAPQSVTSADSYRLDVPVAPGVQLPDFIFPLAVAERVAPHLEQVEALGEMFRIFTKELDEIRSIASQSFDASAQLQTRAELDSGGGARLVVSVRFPEVEDIGDRAMNFYRALARSEHHRGLDPLTILLDPVRADQAR